MPQILFNLDAEKYHADESLSNSLLKQLPESKTPLDFWRASWMNPLREEENTDSQAKKFGRAAHMLVLEGEEEFDKNWGVKKGKKGEPSKSTKEEGMVAEEEYDVLMNVRDHLMKDPIGAEVLKDAKSEVSMFADLSVEVDGDVHHLPVRCRHDIWKPHYSVDLKFQDEVSKDDVGKAIANYGYDFQADWYPRVMALCQPELQHHNFVTGFIEKRPKGPIKILWAAYDPDVLAAARVRVDERLQRFVRLIKQYGTEPWPGFDKQVYTVCAPGNGGEHCITLPQWWNYQQ